MSHFGMDDDFGNVFLRFSERKKPQNLDRWSRRVIHIGEKASPIHSFSPEFPFWEWDFCMKKTFSLHRNRKHFRFALGFGLNPFEDLLSRHHNFGSRNSSSSSSRRDPHRQQMALLGNMFPMRMSLFGHDPFFHDFDQHHNGMVSSVNISFGFEFTHLFVYLFDFDVFSSGNSRPVSKKTTKSTKIINGRRVVTTRWTVFSD